MKAHNGAFPLMALMAVIACVACSEPLEFADWTIPVPEGTRIIEYAAVPLDERQGNRIGVEEDLVLGGDSGDPQQAFYQRPSVVPDDDGNIYVLDRGNHRIQVFNAKGMYLRTLGRQGPGPGELQNPHGIVVTRDRVAVMADQRRLSTWKLDGEHVKDVRVPSGLSGLVGVDDGFVARRADWLGEMLMSAPPTRRFTFALYATDGEERTVYAHTDQVPPAPIDFEGPRVEFFSGVLQARGGVLPTFAARFAASWDGAFYLTTSEEYQIHAYGSQRWSLRVEWERDEVTPRDMANVMERSVSRSLPGAPASAFEWPERFQAIANLLVDGHGHLYVFPFYARLDEPLPRDTERPRIDRPVDVFSPNGAHLFSGLISLGSWTGALGDFVYASRINDETDEDEVIRYRLVEPFE